MKLKYAACYSKDRISSKYVDLENFVTTDNLLQDKKGVTGSTIKPSGTLVAYENGDILVGNIRPYLKKIWHANKSGGCSPDVLAIRAKENTDFKFLYYTLLRDDFFSHMMKGKKGSKMPRGDKNQILDFLIPDITKPEQLKIVTVLSSLDDKIKLNNRINVELETMATTLYNYWFVQFDFPDANGKPYKSSGGKMIWNEELKRKIPEGWKAKTLSDLCKPNEAQLKPSEEIEFINYFDTSSVTKNVVDEPIKITDLKNSLPSRARRKVKTNDIIYSTVRPIQEHYGILKYPFDNMVVSTGFAVLSSKEDANLNDLIYAFLSKSDTIAYLQSIAETSVSSYPSISANDIMALKLAIPTDTSIAKKLSVRLDSINKIIAQNQIQNREITRLRDWLLPMLMNGQVKVREEVKVEKIHKRLSIEAESVATYQTEPITISIQESNKPFAKRVLGGKIVSLFKNDQHFTHIKFQKLQFLAEHIMGADLRWNYYFQSAGPYDPTFMHTVAAKLKESGWYEEQNLKFHPLGKEDKIENYYQGYFGQASDKLNKLFCLLADKTEVETEIIATVYAVWNNRIIKQQPISDDLLVKDFYNWSERKAAYTLEQILSAEQWLRNNGFVPTGFGREIKKAKK